MISRLETIKERLMVSTLSTATMNNDSVGDVEWLIEQLEAEKELNAVAKRAINVMDNMIKEKIRVIDNLKREQTPESLSQGKRINVTLKARLYELLKEIEDAPVAYGELRDDPDENMQLDDVAWSRFKTDGDNRKCKLLRQEVLNA